ncbi:tetratricopeptide repeat protein [Roseateles violae]|uniref:Tetratricopeptide repeat protein n=1 Tax=Roseateles violae TaxID=3058042 RepID=A0ABT8DWK6_9BURK|nr:tetratricopeptide repeat protein [Pelomonas sp. PFR6]MDN3922383.1 tetratricopeptide repeat protein [Pelomonas sp. PFR6]
MPENFRRSAGLRRSPHVALTLLLAACLGQASAQAKPDDSIAAAQDAAASAPVVNSSMDAPLFYQLLVGEMELRTGQAGVAYQVLLDAARRTQDEELFKRVINIALQARAGDQALSAARAWRDSVPTSLEAQQMTIQLLALLNRPAEIAEPLSALMALTPQPQRPALLASLPRLFQRAAEPKKVYASLTPLLQQAAREPGTRVAALAVQARLALQAGETAQALELTRELAQAAPELDDAMQLALELMPTRPEAEALITARLQAQPQNNALRLAYGRALARAQRAAEAAREFRTVTETSPETAAAWFALGTLELDLRHAKAAETALLEYLKRLPEKAADEDAATANTEARQQAWLMLSQAAEQRGDLKAAESWLAKVDKQHRRIETQFRQASLLARQGKLEEGRRLLQALPETSDEDVRAKLLAESQLLRDAQQWQAAYEVLARASARLPADADLLYEQSMMAEKLGRLDEMEALLKKVMTLKPEHHHAYNALGYSLADRNVRLDEARELIVKALSYAPNEPFIVDSMGWVEYRLGNQNEALRLLRQAYAARPDTEIAAHLGEVLWVSGYQDEARRVWQEGAARDPKNEALKETLARLKAKL